MKKVHLKLICAALALLIAALTAPPALAAPDRDAYTAAERAAEYIVSNVKTPTVAPTGGEWAVLGLARGGFEVPEGYYQSYISAVETYVREHDGILHPRKYTEYSRVILALTNLGLDAGDVAGYDLTYPLGDFEATLRQGINGAIWALIALDCGNYPMPVNTEATARATRRMYVDAVLENQLSSGGWSLSGQSADPDLTGMALTALSRYKDDPQVKAAIDRALLSMSSLQDSSGGYTAWGDRSCESAAQMIVALCELGIDLDDGRFVKNGKSLLDNLLTYRSEDGGFRHTGQGPSNLMSTEQCLYALVAAKRAREGGMSLYRMDDARTGEGGGLPGRDSGVTPVPVTSPGKTFPDISGAESLNCRPAVEALAERGIIDGAEGLYRPELTMTRAEFAAVVTRALGLELKPTDDFSDVRAGDWFAPYVGAAYAHGIISGVGGGRFAPGGAVTRQEAAVMLTRAAKLCGLDTHVPPEKVQSALSVFEGRDMCAAWSKEGIAFCYLNRIMDNTDPDIEPLRPMTRGEASWMVYRLLSSSGLL